MSEKIFALLLRVYPSRFRKAYGDDALQLFRDRARDEKGFFSAIRLWFDLLADFTVSLPREYLQAHKALAGAAAWQRATGMPSLFVFEDEPLGLGALLSGGVLSLFALGVFDLSLTLVGHRVSGMPSALGQPQSQSRSSRQQVPPPAPPEAANAINPTAAAGGTLDAAERQRVIDGTIANLKRHYVYPDVAQKMADSLLAREKAGDYDAITDGAALAGLLTRQLRDASHDLHLEVVYSNTPLPERPIGPTPERAALYRNAMEQQNCTFENAQMLPHNIGYFKLNSFPDPSVCREKAVAAMASLNGADAIIFDLRDNRGGYPSMVMLIAAYLFDHPEYMYNPRENTTQQSWTQSPVPGNKLTDKPVYVLTSGRTFSGAEHFSYDLKMLKRATLVGETTGGATDVGIFHRIDDHFGMGIRETRAINPYAEPDWAVEGVEPDVKVNAADALETAVKLAATKLHKH
jgi:hypothetical protein